MREKNRRPSVTALLVASNRSRLSRSSIDAEGALEEAVLSESLIAPNWRWVRHLWPPGLGWRTELFDRFVESGIEAGFTQVVILGAGYDGRALRFRSAGVCFFEVDQEPVQRDKRCRLAAMGADLKGVRHVVHDLSHPGLVEVLLKAGADPSLPTLILCEGVLLYLPETAAAALLHSLRSSFALGSRIAVIGREVDASASPHSRMCSGARLIAQRLVLGALRTRALHHTGGQFGLVHRVDGLDGHPSKDAGYQRTGQLIRRSEGPLATPLAAASSRSIAKPPV